MADNDNGSTGVAANREQNQADGGGEGGRAGSPREAGGELWQKLLLLVAGVLVGFVANLGNEVIRQDYHDLAARKVVRVSEACQGGSCQFELRMTSRGSITKMEVQVLSSGSGIAIRAAHVDYGQSGFLQPDLTTEESPGAGPQMRGFTLRDFRQPQEVRYRVDYTAQGPVPAIPLILSVESGDPDLVVTKGGLLSGPGWTDLMVMVVALASLGIVTLLTLYYHHQYARLRGEK